MASSIGSFDFLTMAGPQVPQLASAVEIIDRKGTDGYAHRDPALKAEEVQVRTVEGVSSASSANSAADDYAALKGARVTVEDGRGRITYQVLVVDVRVVDVKRTLLNTDAFTDYLVYAVWLLRPTQ